MPNSAAQGLVARFFQTLLAMLLGLYASTTAGLRSFIIWVDDDPVPVWIEAVILVLGAALSSTLSFRCAWFFLDTFGMEKTAAGICGFFVACFISVTFCKALLYVSKKIMEMQLDAEGPCARIFAHAMGLLAILLGLFASIIAGLESFVIWVNEVFDDPLPFSQEAGLIALRVVTVSASYFRCAEFFKDTFGLDEMAAVVGATFVSISLAAACSLPFEYVMIQIRNMQPDAQGKYPYTGLVDCAFKTFKSGGPLKFYTGFFLYCAKIFPHVMVLCIIKQLLK